MKFYKLFLLFVLFYVLPAFSCTTFVLKDDNHLIFGRNLDWVSDDGHVVINKRGIKKTALVFPPETPASWTSIYGSVSFNQFGKEFPYGGMNEKGLVIEIMRSKAEYPKPDQRPALNELQWVQYQLDNAATVDDVLKYNNIIRIRPVKEELHFLVCDQSGHSAVLEFKNGKLEVFRDKNLPLPILANSYYPEDLNHYKNHQSCRFTKVANHLKSYAPSQNNPIDYSFKILKDVALEGSWSIVYDIKQQEIHFKSNTSKQIKRIQLSGFNFSCEQPSLYFPIPTELEGNITSQFKPYSHTKNTEILKLALFKNEIQFPSAVAEQFYQYAQSPSCSTDK